MGNQLRTAKACRRRVSRKHAARGVDRDDDITPLGFDFKFTVAEAWLCQAKDHASNGQQQGDHPKVALQRAHTGGKLTLQPWSKNLGKKHIPPAVCLHEKPDEGTDQQ